MGCSQVANLKLKCARLERELQEFRTATPRLQRPTNLGGGLPRSPTPVSSPEDASPTNGAGKRSVGKIEPVLSEDEQDTVVGEMDTSMVSLSQEGQRGA